MFKKLRSNKKLRYAAYVILIWVAIHITYITIDGLRDYNGSADVAVVLGNTVYGPGNLSPWMKGRADAALKFYKETRVKKIFASGGISRPEDGGYPEGTAIKEYLVEQGVPDDDVIADNAGKNTFLTAKTT
jgi:vancomycin permeability regulator SanA